MILLDKNKNPSSLGKYSMKSYMTRNIVMKQMSSQAKHAKRTSSAPQPALEKRVVPSRVTKKSPPAVMSSKDGSTQDENKSFIKHLYNLRPTEFRVEEFVSVIDDPSLKELEKNRELSPNTKLRILQRKLEAQRK